MAEDADLPLGHPNKDWWLLDDIAAHWGVKPKTVRTYRTRDRGELPPEDRKFGREPAWKPKTIINFKRSGSRTGIGRPAQSRRSADPRDGQ